MAVLSAAQVVWLYLYMGGTLVAMITMALALFYLTPTYHYWAVKR
jgi:hypothetical protein